MKTRLLLAWMSGIMAAGCGLLIGLEDRELPAVSPDAPTDGPSNDATTDSPGDAKADGAGDADAGEACACDAGCNPDNLCLDEILAIGMGRNHQCILRGDGKIFCLGDNDFGQLGKAGADITSFTEVPISGVLFRELVVGSRGNCAISRDRDLYCWGRNNVFQLGHDGGAVALPQKVDLGVLKVKSVSVGSQATCAIVDVATGPNIRCWGNASNGELGLGFDPNDGGSGLFPIAVPQTVKGLRASSVHVSDGDADKGGRACALAEADGKPHCWGGTENDEITDTSPAMCDVDGTPHRCVLEPLAWDTTQSLAIGNGVSDVCALQVVTGQNNRIFCRGTTSFALDQNCQTSATGFQITIPAAAGNPNRMVSTAAHRCFTNPAQDLYCFGNNSTFQMAREGSDKCPPQAFDRRPAEPLRLTFLPDGGDLDAGEGVPIKAKLLAVGQFDVLVYTPDKRLIGWGANQEGQLGPIPAPILDRPSCKDVGGLCQGPTIIALPTFP